MSPKKRVITCMQMQMGSGSRAKSKSSGKCKLTCFYCKKESHFKKDCKKRKNEFEKC